jgi:3-oxoacyl-[acyl-carrier-protein] synthase-3
MKGGETGAGDRAVICGIGYWLPARVVTNAELCARLDTSEDWILSRTGISCRRRIEPGEATSDLAVEAGNAALKSAGGMSVEAVVLATTTPDYRCPATAPAVASRLGLGGVAAFDVSAVCSGFLYGLATAAGFIAAGMAERVLLIAAEAFSTLLDPDDRTTLPIFGDGAGAVVLRRGRTGEPGAIGPVVLGSDGDRSELIMVKAGGSRQRSQGPVSDSTSQYFQMRGRDVYRQAIERMSAAGTQALTAAGWQVSDVDRLVAHQANARINDYVRQQLGVPAAKLPSNIERFGNTSAGTLPILIDEQMRGGHLKHGDLCMLLALGAGVHWGCALVRW